MKFNLFIFTILAIIKGAADFIKSLIVKIAIFISDEGYGHAMRQKILSMNY